MANSAPLHHIAILVGSLRKGSINRKIARSIVILQQARLTCEIVETGDLLPFNEDQEGKPSPEYTRFRQQITAADGVLFCTPEYNRGVPGQLKNAIDIGSRPYGQSVWSGKPAAIIGASPGPIGAFGANHHIRQYCAFLDMPVMQQPEAYLGGVSADAFDAEGIVKDGPLKDVIVNITTAFADWVDRLA